MVHLYFYVSIHLSVHQKKSAAGWVGHGLGTGRPAGDGTAGGRVSRRHPPRE